MRRALLALASVSALLLAACGSSTIESQFVPARAVVFGDAFSDYGQRGARYTVNDGSINLWTYDVIASFGLTIAPSATGGLSYATGSARVNTKPDAAGDNTTLTVKEQVDAFLAGNAPTATDLVIVSGGIGDIIAEVGQLKAGTQTEAQAIADVQQAGRDLGAQVRRLVQAGATHVVVTGTYDLGKTPWATATSQNARLTDLSTKFNTELLVSIVDLGANVLYVDAALLFNLMAQVPEAYNLTDSVHPVCNSIDPGVGIGIGAGEVKSALCTTSTLINVNYGPYLFADKVYPATAGHIKFGDYAYQRVHARW
jgi:phospholipase/lecithinase/hemolysin